MKRDYSLAWIHEMEASVAILQQQQQPSSSDAASTTAADDDQAALETSLQFLQHMEAILGRIPQRKWKYPPYKAPPKFSNHNHNNHNHNNHHELLTPSVLVTSTTSNSQPSQGLFEHANPYAVFEDDDDDDDDSASQQEQKDDDDDDEAGDEPILHHQHQQEHMVLSSTSYDIRRLFIRILAHTSDIYAAKAMVCRHQRPCQWSLGAHWLGQALTKTHQALDLADSQISHWLAYHATDDHDDDHNHNATTNTIISLLSQDARIVQVSLQSLTEGQDKFLAQAQRQERYLQRKLRPQWNSRDEVKRRIGMERWKNNPAPKFDYAQLRQDAELELRDIEKALAKLQELKNPTLQAQASTALLLERLQQQQPQQQQGDEDVTTRANNNNNDGNQQPQRYNGQRPAPQLLQRRIGNWHEYPDPTEYGWTFTGSSGVTEFFEKHHVNMNNSNNSNSNDDHPSVLVKLDWYFTTGTVKTSLHHPTQGKTQLFAAKVDPNTYLQILQNPRQHTNVGRYHHRPGRGRGRGRGRGGRGGGFGSGGFGRGRGPGRGARYNRSGRN